MTARETIKLWFIRGARPLAEQFAQWLDSYVHKEDEFPLEQVTGLRGTLDAETAARCSADNALLAALNQETAQRGQADAALQSGIDAEAQARASADNALQAAINQETANREQAIADTVAASQFWKPAVEYMQNLPVITGTEQNKTWLCRVRDTNDVYQRIAGASTAWLLYSANTDYIDEQELLSVLSPYAAHIADSGKHYISAQNMRERLYADGENNAPEWLLGFDAGGLHGYYCRSNNLSRYGHIHNPCFVYDL